MKKVLIATTNKDKQKEIIKLFASTGITIIFPQDLTKTPKEVKETGKTFAQNALIKAKAFAQISNLITLADDTGLVIDSLQGKPGVLSARLAPTDSQKITKILTLLKKVSPSKRTASFVTSICIYNPFKKTYKIINGKINGLISTKARGTSGFGYDPIFYIPKLNKTFAQISLKQKNSISHRGIAFKKTISYLQKAI